MIPKGERGDDVIANLLALCGDGTRGCHGALHGNPYEVNVGVPGGYGNVYNAQRRDSQWVRARIGKYISLERPDTVEYVASKLGREAGSEYLNRNYLVVVPVM